MPDFDARLTNVERAQLLLEDAQRLHADTLRDHADTLRRHADALDLHRREMVLLRQLAERQEALLQALKDLLERGNGH